MSYPKVTLIVVPHECFSYTEQSLESIYKYTNIPFKLIYIDVYSPKNTKQYLEEKSHEKGFQLIRTEKYVSQNQARNIGLKHVDTEYVVFIKNNVIVTHDWLNHLMDCAQATQAAVVSPVCLEGALDKAVIHSAGGSLEFQYKNGNLDLFEEKLFVKNSFDKVQPLLTRQPTQLIDFSCFLVRTSVLQQIGNLDENLMSVAQDIDFSLSVFAAGGSIYIEPKSIVNHLAVTQLKLSDIPYYLLTANYVWKRKSIHHFQKKWGLAKEAQFIAKMFEDIKQPNYLPFQPLKEILKPLYVYESSYTNPSIFKRS